MLLLFGGLFLMLVGYGAWCGRTFYLRAPMPDLSLMPQEARALALAKIEEMDLRRPEKLTVNRFTELLMKPYESDPSPISIDVAGNDLFLILRGDGTDGLILGKDKDESEWVSGGAKKSLWK